MGGGPDQSSMKHTEGSPWTPTCCFSGGLGQASLGLTVLCERRPVRANTPGSHHPLRAGDCASVTSVPRAWAIQALCHLRAGIH